MSQEYEGAGDGQRRQLRGPLLIDGAMDAGEAVRLVLCARGELSGAASRLIARAERAGIPVRAISDRELRRLSLGREGAEVLALVGPDPAIDLPTLLARDGAVWLLVGTAYPGNAGFVIRTAEVSGADGVVIDASFDRSARRDAHRAAMRADRYLPVCFERAAATIDQAVQLGRRIIAIEDVGRRAPWEVDLSGRVLFAVGGEEHGIPESLLARADEVLRIPMAGFIPSYNLQAAVAAVMAERLRQLAGR